MTSNSPSANYSKTPASPPWPCSRSRWASGPTGLAKFRLQLLEGFLEISLEDLGFDITKDTGKAVHIAVGERDQRRKMSSKPLVEALKKDIERQSESR